MPRVKINPVDNLDFSESDSGFGQKQDLMKQIQTALPNISDEKAAGMAEQHIKKSNEAAVISTNASDAAKEIVAQNRMKRDLKKEMQEQQVNEYRWGAAKVESRGDLEDVHTPENMPVKRTEAKVKGKDVHKKSVTKKAQKEPKKPVKIPVLEFLFGKLFMQSVKDKPKHNPKVFKQEMKRPVQLEYDSWGDDLIYHEYNNCPGRKPRAVDAGRAWHKSGKINKDQPVGRPSAVTLLKKQELEREGFDNWGDAELYSEYNTAMDGLDQDLYEFTKGEFMGEHDDKALVALEQVAAQKLRAIDDFEVSDIADFRNDINNLQTNQRKISNKLNDLSADFSNHMTEYHSSVRSVELERQDFSHKNEAHVRHLPSQAADWTNAGVIDADVFNNKKVHSAPSDADTMRIVSKKQDGPKKTLVSVIQNAINSFRMAKKRSA